MNLSKMNNQQNNQHLTRRKFLAAAAVTGASSLLLPCVSGIALAADPTLDETLKWLKEKVDRIELKQLKDNYHTHRTITFNLTYSLADYIITYTRIIKVEEDHGKQRRTGIRTGIYTFPLNRLQEICYLEEPKSIKLTTLNERKLIRWVETSTCSLGVYPNTEKEGYTNSRPVEMKTIEDADRAQKAFEHAIKLSAGKGSPKPSGEPF